MRSYFTFLQIVYKSAAEQAINNINSKQMFEIIRCSDPHIEFGNNNIAEVVVHKGLISVPFDV